MGDPGNQLCGEARGTEKLRGSWSPHPLPCALVAKAPPPVTTRSRRALAGVLTLAALLIVAYWVAWFADRSLVAAEHSAPYVQFEGAFPLADGWLALCLAAGAVGLLAHLRTTLLWLLAGGGAGLYLFGMDDLYDLQHGLWTKGTNGAIELAINLVTLVLSLFVLRWAWTRRDPLLDE